MISIARGVASAQTKMAVADGTYLLNMSVTKSISCSAAAIFSAEDGCGRPNPNMEDMVGGLVLIGEVIECI